MPRASFFLLALALCGCASSPSSSSCVLPQQKPMLVAQLFFGRDMSGRDPVTDAAWSKFAADVLAKEFPDGFTVSDGEGSWRDPRSGGILREPSKIVTIASDPKSDPGPRLNAVVESYKAHFHQYSAGVLTYRACGAF